VVVLLVFQKGRSPEKDIRATQGASDFGDEDNDAGDLARTTANNQKRLESMIARE
jgi:hypothetical protein